MAKVIELTADIAALESLADRLDQLDADTLAEVATNSVNAAAEFAYDLSKRNILSTVNLTDAYVRAKSGVRPAQKSSRPRAVVFADGVLTSLGHYGAAPQIQPVKDAARSKGWPAAGVPPGQKQAGVSVAVKPGARKLMPGAFVLPGKVDSEGNPILFIRQKSGAVNPNTGRPKVEALLGPSVYQMFNTQITAISDGITDNLEQTLLDQAEEAIKKVLE